MLRFPESRIHVPKLDAQSEARGHDYLRELITKQGHSFPLSACVRFGVPAEQIVETARTNNVDLIVMSTHGTAASERNRYAIGSTAWRVLQETPCPVFLVPS